MMITVCLVFDFEALELYLNKINDIT